MIVRMHRKSLILFLAVILGTVIGAERTAVAQRVTEGAEGHGQRLTPR